MNGRTSPFHGAGIGRLAGGVGRQVPGAGGAVNMVDAFQPSFSRNFRWCGPLRARRRGAQVLVLAVVDLGEDVA